MGPQNLILLDFLDDSHRTSMHEQAAQRSEHSKIFLELAANRSASEDGLHIPAISRSQASDEKPSGMRRRIYRIGLLVAVPL